jgi:hypothetical protein
MHLVGADVVDVDDEDGRWEGLVRFMIATEGGLRDVRYLARRALSFSKYSAFTARVAPIFSSG